MKKNLKYIYLILFGLILGSCIDKQLDGIDNTDVSQNLENYDFPANFDFSTTRNVQISLVAPSFIKESVFDIYTKSEITENTLLATGTFDMDNKYEFLLNIPTFIDSIEIRSKSFGLEKSVILPVLNGVANYDYGVHYNTAIVESSEKSAPAGGMNNLKSALVSKFNYMGSYTANGYPSYLFQVNDHAWESLFSNLNQTLPEGKSVPLSKPAFLASGTQTNLVLKQKSNVYVTFAGEGTDQTSALGYFIYNGSLPADNQHTIIFPNASAPGSGGSLHSGDKVLLGEFQAGTTIGWFLVPNGWDKTGKTVIDKKGIYYSVPSFNPESSENLKQHMVLLKDIQNEVIVLGFEDTRRDNGTSDNDFNDAVFYITLDNLASADFTNVYSTTSPVDTDGDGIIDALDAYPTDPTLAFNNHLVTGSTGSLAFEDLWPYKGDFDFNDLVIDYQYNPITDANNLVKVLEISLNVRHIGGSFHNGFAIELPVLASTVQSVTGAKMTKGYVNLSTNGTESGVSKAVIFAFEDGWEVNGSTIVLKVTFNNAIATSALGTFPYNPFMVIGGDRGVEVHLVDKAPTSKVNTALFGQADDYSNPSTNRYYRTAENLPWAINIANAFAVPKEKNGINKGYLKFVDWAKSAGSQYPDWYLDLTGYRDTNFLY